MKPTLESLIFNQFLLPVDNGTEAILIYNGNIASLEPAIGRDSVFRGFKIVEITPVNKLDLQQMPTIHYSLHHTWTTYPQFTS